MTYLKIPYNTINRNRLHELDMPPMTIYLPNSEGSGREFSMYVFIEDSNVYPVIKNLGLPEDDVQFLNEDDEDLPTSIDSHLFGRHRLFDLIELFK